MVQVSYPGVYIQEVSSGVRAITGVSTSIGAFLGRASKGPIDKAVRLFSYADYQRSFGEPHPAGDLAEAVKLFFDNGGSDCYVIRIAPGALRGEAIIKNLAGGNVLKAKAKAKGSWANTVRLEVDYNTPYPDDTFNLRVIHEEGGVAVKTESFMGLTMDHNSPRFAPDFVKSSSALIDLELHDDVNEGGPRDIYNISNSFNGYSQSRRPIGVIPPPVGPSPSPDIREKLNLLLNTGPYAPRSRFEISVDDLPFVPVDIGPWSTTEINAANEPVILERFASRINDALDEVSPTAEVSVSVVGVDDLAGMLKIESVGVGAANDRKSVHIRSAPERDLAEVLMLGVGMGGIEPARYSNYRPAPTASILCVGTPGGAGGAINILNDLASLQVNSIETINIGGIAVDLGPSGEHSIQTVSSTTPFHESEATYSPQTGNWDGVREKLHIIAEAITAHPDLAYRSEVWGYTLAIIATDGHFNTEPSSIETTPPTTPPFSHTNKRFILNPYQVTLAGGTDGGPPMAADFIGAEAEQTGFYALEPVDLFNLMVIPRDEALDDAAMSGLWGKAAVYCKRNRAFLIIDSPKDWTNSSTGMAKVLQDSTKIGVLRNRLGSAKDYAAVFYPRLRINGKGVTGAGGAVAGVMARTDANRGVWKAPAGIEAGINSITGLNVVLTDAQNGVLNKQGVNCLRVLPNGTSVVWGARTLDGDDATGSEWKYISIRRFALFLEESLYRGTRWAVFEPNDEPLWANLRLNINAFLFSLFRQQAFQGSSPKEAYYVRCDKTTTTQDDRNKGIVNIEVGFAPLKPAEFVVIQIQQIAGEL